MGENLSRGDFLKLNKFILISLFLLVILSAGAVSAAEDSDITANDVTCLSEADEKLSVSDEYDSIGLDDGEITNYTSNSNIVTQNNFFDFFDDSGSLKEDVTFDELVFEGQFNAPVTDLILEKSLSVVGNNAVLNNMGVQIYADNVNIDHLTFNADDSLGRLIHVEGSNVNLTNLIVNYSAGTEEAVAVDIVGANDVNLINSTIFFESNVPNDEVIAIAVQLVNARNVLIDNNIITTLLPCVYVMTYDEDYYMMGSNNVNPVKFKDCTNLRFTNNVVDSKTNDYSADYPTIQSIFIIGCQDSIIDHNEIYMIDNATPSGMDNYMYGITFGHNTNVTFSYNNFIMSTKGGKDSAGTAYAFQGVESDIVIKGNNITTISNGPNLGIYVASMGGETSELLIEDNFINVTGFASASGSWALVSGIEIQNGNAKIYNNTIYSQNVNEYDDASYIYGISYAQWMYGSRSFDIQNNTIYSQGKYTISIIDASSFYAGGNILYAYELAGDKSINTGNCQNVDIGPNEPSNKTATILNVTTSAKSYKYGSDAEIIITLTDRNGTPIDGQVTVTVNGVNYAVTVVNGMANLVISGLESGSYGVVVKFAGNDIYASSVNSDAVILINKSKVVTANVEVDDTVYGNPAVLKITDLCDAEGKKLSAFGGYQLVGPVTPYGSISVSKGKATVNIDNLPAGNYTIYVVFGNNPGQDYEFTNYIVNFTVFKAQSVLTSNIDDYHYGTTGILAVKATDINNNTINGYLDVYIDGMSYCINSTINGNANISVENLTVDTHTADVIFYSDNFEQTNSSVQFNVLEEIIVYDTEVFVNGSEVKVANDAFIDVLVASGDEIIAVPVIVNVNGRNVTTVTTSRNWTHVVVSADNLIEGINNVTVYYDGNDTYNPSNANATITVVPKPVNTIKAVASDVVYPENVLVNVIADVDGVYVVDINGTEFNVTANGEGLTLALGAGSYSAVIVGDYTTDDYDFATENATFTVEKAINNIEIIAEDTILPNEVSVKVIADVDGTYTVVIGNNTFDVAVVSGEGLISISLPEGEYAATVRWENENYSACVLGSLFNVEKAVLSINVSADSISYGDDLIVSVQMPSDVSRRPTVTVGGESKYVTLKNGSGSVKFSGLGVGTYTVEVTHAGDNNYMKASVNTTVKVNKAVPQIKVTSKAIAYGEDLTVEVQMPSDVARRANVIIDGNITKAVSLKEGAGSVKFSGLSVGTHSIEVSYNGDDNYAKASANKTVKVNRGTPEIKITGSSNNDVLTVNIQMPSDVSRRVSVTLEGVTKTVSLNDGVASVKFTGLAPGSYNVQASYAGDNNYLKTSVNKTLKVNRYAPEIKVTAKSVRYGDDLTVEVQMPADVSRRITLTIANQTKTVSLKDGLATVKFSGLAVGTYGLEVSYGGDSNYLKASVNKTVKISKAVPEISVSASDISVGEKLSVDVQLPSDVTRRATVSVEDQTKTVTLKNGAANVIFEGLEAGSHEVKVSYGGDSNYKASENSTVVNVKQ